jgi:hypothetical protein|tara:strand:+ start:1102 stop:1611 length:510 start_codon:yes stop_codon:yes gene_type:complete
MLALNFVVSHPRFIPVTTRNTQETYYRENGACAQTLDLVRINPKSYGAFVEDLVRSFLHLDPPFSSEHDAVVPRTGTKIEIKAPRFCSSGDFFIQHIKPTHDFDLILVAILEPIGGFTLLVIEKKIALQLSDDQRGEGRIVKGTRLIKHGEIVTNQSELLAFIFSLNSK